MREIWRLLCVLLFLTGGCVSMQTVKLGPEDVPDPAEEEIVGVTTVDGHELEYDPPGGTVRDQFITGTVAGNVRVTAIEDVQLFWVRRNEIDVGMTILAGVGVAGLVAVAVGVVAAVTVLSDGVAL